jgi:hypothetical protein
VHDDVVRHMTKHLVITHVKWYNITSGNHADLEFISCYNIISTLPIAMEMKSKNNEKTSTTDVQLGTEVLICI